MCRRSAPGTFGSPLSIRAIEANRVNLLQFSTRKTRSPATPAHPWPRCHDDAEGDANRGRDGDLLEGRELLAHALEEGGFRGRGSRSAAAGTADRTPAVMPKEHTTRSFAPPGPPAPFSPSIVPSVLGGRHPATAVETPPVTSTEQPRSPNMSVRLSTERRHPGAPSSPAAGPFAPLATGQPGSDAAPFGAAGGLPDPADLRRAKDLTMARNGPPTTANQEDPANRRLVVVAAFDVVNFSALVEADEERVLAAWRALRRAIDPLIAAGRRPHLQVAGRRPAGRVHQPGRGDARGARGPGGGRPGWPPERDMRAAASCAAPSTWARSPSKAPTCWATASTSCRACRSMRRSAACWCRPRSWT